MSTETPRESDESENSGENGPNGGIPVPPNNSPPNNETTATQPKSRAFKRREFFCRRVRCFFKKWKDTFEAIAVMAAVVYAICTIKEWRTFDSERQTMEREFGAVQTNAFLEERAWVVPFLIEKGPPENTNSYATWNVIFKNTGKTPAIKARSFLGDATRIEDIPENDSQNAFGPYIVLAPGAEVNIAIDVVKTNVIDRIKRGQLMYIYGTIWYDDIFNKHHWTQFCYQGWGNFQFFAGGSVHTGCDPDEGGQ